MNRPDVTRARVFRLSTSSLLAAGSVAMVVAPVAHAADAADGERGLPTAAVEAADWAQASTDPTVMAAYAKFLAAAARSEAREHAIEAAQGAVAKAKQTPDAADDRQARKALARARQGLATSRVQAAELKSAWDVVISDRLAELEAAHGGATAGAAGPSGPADGVYVGKVSRKNPFGDIQVTLTVADGKVSDCKATYPTERQSGTINTAAIPALCSEVVSAQSAAIGAVGGASYTSPAFKDSLADAIRKAGL